ncbi:MAG: DUF1460 domain-containing protein [Bacteroidetes bacterium]|nr:MAG: DUF1460 domain-containing protein [Bacteroidota bacterium]
MRLPVSLILIVLSTLGTLSAQVRCTAKDRDLCESHLKALAEEFLSEAPMTEIIPTVGHRFIGTPYVAHTLEGETEELVVDLQGLDCTTFLENVVVLSRLVARDALTFADFQAELAGLRYREGVVEGYPSRLHYFSDWLYQNAQKGLITDITAELGGDAYEKEINFMSTHPDAYAQLGDPATLAAIEETEAAINSRRYYYIPKDRIEAVEDRIADGDLIALTSRVEGLDIAHVGLAIHVGDRLHFMHASSRSMKVEISTIPLVEYMAKSHTGIMVARLEDPRL